MYLVSDHVVRVVRRPSLGLAECTLQMALYVFSALARVARQFLEGVCQISAEFIVMLNFVQIDIQKYTKNILFLFKFFFSTNT